MDPKLVASSPKQKYEIKSIGHKYKIPLDVIRGVIKKLKEEGKGFRSRKIIYARLRELGYTIETKKK